MTATLNDPPGTVAVRSGGRPSLAATFGWEVRKLRAQYRTRITLLAVLVAPLPVAVIVHGQSRAPKDTLFGRYATTNGFALALLILGFAAQWVLPLLTAVVAGDIFASEDQHGTWKTVLTRSASRGQLFVAKVLAALAFTLVVLLVLTTSVIISSVLAGGHGVLTGLTGQPIPPAQALTLVTASWLSAIPPAIGFTGLAVLVSVWSRSPAAGIAVPVVLGLVMQLAGTLGGIEPVRPFLLSTPYEAWHGLLAEPRFTGPLVTGLITSGLWAAITLIVAHQLLRRRDITGG